MKRGPGRPPKASPIRTKSGHSARVWVEEEGVWRRKQVPLGTRSPVVARHKGKLLLRGELAPLVEAARESFESAARRIVGASSIGTKGSRLSRLERYAFPVIGDLPVSAVTSVEIKSVLAEVEGALGWTGTVRHMKNDISAVLGPLFEDKIIAENAALRIQFKKKDGSLGGKRIKRVLPPRLVLGDDEIERFLAFGLEEGEGELGELFLLSLCARIFGMRTSDLHAWRYEHLDSAGWADAYIPRPKTDAALLDDEDESESVIAEDWRHEARHALPAGLVPHLESWWRRHGRPVAGPVFPCRRGKRAGLPKRVMSYAQALRDALWRAGIVRPLPGFAQATTEEARRGLCAIQAGVARRQARLDFHSFRRASATANGASGLSLREAMLLTHHKDPAVWARYQARGATTIVVPESAVPTILPPTTAVLPEGKTKIPSDIKRARTDSNGRPLASENAGKVLPEPFSAGFDNRGGTPEHDKTPCVTEQRQNPTAVFDDALTALIAAAAAAGEWDTVTALAEVARKRAAAPTSPVTRLDDVRNKRK